MDTEKQIRQILASPRILGAAAEDLTSGTDLWDAGLNSLAYVNLMLTIELECDIEFPPELVSPEVFRTIETIAETVRRVRSESSVTELPPS